MTNLSQNPGWDDVYQLETTDRVLGGVSGVSNRQAQSLINRTGLLKDSRVIDSVAVLRSVDKTQHAKINVAGYSAPGDGGGGIYYLDTADTTSNDNAGTIIVAADGGRWKLAYQSNLSPHHFGAVGDGVADDTNAFQSCILAAANGTRIYGLPGKTYKLSKNPSLLPLLYPVRAGNTTSEQPCLVVYAQTSLDLDGCGSTLSVPVHAQGCWDIFNSSRIKIHDWKMVGPGGFPPLDGTTGRSEKGVVGAGYYDSGAVANGPARNNSRDTSAYTAGGYGGAFPQYGGGTAATWGTWAGGGYIANAGSAIAIFDGSTDIEIYNNEIHGFNEDGIQISSVLLESYGYTTVGRVYIHNNYIHDNYNAGIEYHNVLNVVIDSSNKIINNGHPNAAITDSVIDPGYGIASNNGTAAQNIVIAGNILTGNKRKGIDAHSLDTATITDNIISDSGYGIMLVNGSGGSIRNVTVTGNIVQRIAYPSSAQAAGIYVERNSGGAAGFSGNANITGNQVYEVGVPPGSTGSFPGADPYGIGIQLSGTLTGVSVTGNIIQNSTYLGFIGVDIGFAGTDTILGIATGNSIRGAWKEGINNSSTGNTGNLVACNNVELTSISPYTGLQTGIVGATDRYFMANNISVPSGQSFLTGTAQNLELIVHITLSGGTVSYTTGFGQSKYVVGVSSIANGIQIDLASGMAVQGVFVSQTVSTKAYVTSGSPTTTPIDYIYTKQEFDPVQIGLQSAGVDQAATAVTGHFTVRISI